ncbi:MAG: tRNA pseudouridine(38-40) synthase TruA [Chloroflexota bacterium]|nr:tRNA pseudouridine(38-40) synthase TruA [Chloroflexota bacterium]
MHLKLTIQYDGTGFVGSQLQAQGRGRTVQGELELALARIVGEPIRVALAGRTDSGVHAWGQVASLDLPARERLGTAHLVMRALNGVLPRDVAVTAAEEIAEGFHARFSAVERAYRYLIWNAEQPAPLLSRYSLHVRHSLDLGAIAGAANLLTGKHDLAAFAGQGMGVPRHAGEGPDTVRTVLLAGIKRVDATANFWAWNAPAAVGMSGAQVDGSLLALDVVANAFLPQMIRTIVGTLLEVGQGKRTVDDFGDLLESRDRRKAGPTAKPHGLCLLWVAY